MYKVRFIYWDGSKEDEFFDTKVEAVERCRYVKSGGYNAVVKKRINIHSH